VALLAIAFAFCGITEEAVLCEESAAHLSECCPFFRPHFLKCETPSFPTGCAEVDVESDQARCILGRSCSELQADGTCDRALSQWTEGETPTPDRWPVCR
jgi:hypothetical protein